MPDGRKVQRLLNVVFLILAMAWIAGAIVIAAWEISSPPVLVHGSKR